MTFQSAITPSNLVPEGGQRETGEVFRKFIQEHPLLSFRGKLFKIPGKVTELTGTLRHNLGFVPKHLMHLTDYGGTLVFNMKSADTRNIKYVVYAAGYDELSVLLGTFGD